MANILDGQDSTATTTMSDANAQLLAKQYADLLNAENALKQLKATSPKDPNVKVLSNLVDQIKSVYGNTQSTAQTSYASERAGAESTAANKTASDAAAAKAAADAAAVKAAADADAAKKAAENATNGKNPPPIAKTEKGRTVDANGHIIVTYSDDTTEDLGLDPTWVDPNAKNDNTPKPTVYTATDGTTFTDQNAYATYQASLNAKASAAAASNSAEALYKMQVGREKTMAKDQVTAWLKTLFDENNPEDKTFMLAATKFIQDQIDGDIPAEAVMLNMRGEKFYQQRFAGNEALRKAGLAEYAPGDYLAAERVYSSILTNAGLGNLAKRNTFATLIGNQIDATELQDRVKNVYDRINNADTALQDELKNFWNMGLSKSDLAEALLMGSEGAASLKRKISMAEIGAEFTPRGLTSALGVQELANLGVTREQAQTGAEFTQQGMRSLTKLSDIYNQSTAGLQTELETEAFKGVASQRRKQLTAAEKAAFAGSAGTGIPSLGRSSAGAI